MDAGMSTSGGKIQDGSYAPTIKGLLLYGGHHFDFFKPHFADNRESMFFMLVYFLFFMIRLAQDYIGSNILNEVTLYQEWWISGFSNDTELQIAEISAMLACSLATLFSIIWRATDLPSFSKPLLNVIVHNIESYFSPQIDLFFKALLSRISRSYLSYFNFFLKKAN